MRIQAEAQQIIESAISICYFMRGGIQYKDMFRTTHEERELMGKFLKKRMEQEKDKMVPIY